MSFVSLDLDIVLLFYRLFAEMAYLVLSLDQYCCHQHEVRFVPLDYSHFLSCSNMTHFHAL